MNRFITNKIIESAEKKLLRERIRQNVNIIKVLKEKQEELKFRFRQNYQDNFGKECFILWNNARFRNTILTNPDNRGSLENYGIYK